MTIKAHQLEIVEKHRQIIPYVASLKDFTYTIGSQIDPNEVINNPQISLYCFDDDNERAIFVELPSEVELTDSPFVYSTQYEQAQGLISLSYEEFIDLGKKLPAIQNPIFIHITGRSGSTLLSHAFNQSKQVASLSEPDCITQFAHFREQGKDEESLRLLAERTMRFLFKNNHQKHILAHAVKFRNEGIRVIDLFQTAFPKGKSLFLYRDALGFVASFYRIWQAFEIPEQMPLSDWMAGFADSSVTDPSHLRQYFDAERENASSVERLTIWWLGIMEWYLDQVDRGAPVAAVRFEDISQNKEETLRQIFSYCGLPSNSLDQALDAFNQDSQADTIFARKDSERANKLELSEEQVKSIQAILQRHPVLKTSDFTVPQTLNISNSNS